MLVSVGAVENMMWTWAEFPAVLLVYSNVKQRPEDIYWICKLMGHSCISVPRVLPPSRLFQHGIGLDRETAIHICINDPNMIFPLWMFTVCQTEVFNILKTAAAWISASFVLKPHLSSKLSMKTKETVASGNSSTPHYRK